MKNIDDVFNERENMVKEWIEKFDDMTEKQKEIIKDNLRAYLHNFGFIKIVKEDFGNGFYVFTDEQRVEGGSWTQYCYNIDYLNGWLFGCVQAANGIMKKQVSES